MMDSKKRRDPPSPVQPSERRKMPPSSYMGNIPLDRRLMAEAAKRGTAAQIPQYRYVANANILIQCCERPKLLELRKLAQAAREERERTKRAVRDEEEETQPQKRLKSPSKRDILDREAG